ncbi:uncharacterized protein A1O9_00153 [Exophiala aquamarina CBS 119918]|uniref:RING-type domain-containing protein n=1 Tax=Exophiala aquamarina CBS 119918 TaxID=1182545 RepID=A0A072PQM7_9EURO|nr:uncharacterized protein A1O9_00153 [Exophiala aquamarina CBS 119918]KEF62181.1 hypothetical protein A1O9_00153 [Exophiala aquamarina CBS 119918]
MAGVDESLLGTFQKHIEDMRNLSLCKICIKPFYEPFILGCGHTYCYSCLASWFGGAQGRKKNRNCPDCRAVVTIQPSPNYLLRDLVHMFVGRVELLPEDETMEEHQQAKEEEAGVLAADRAGPGLFKGVFLRRPHHIIRPGHGVLDEDDNVVRCPECYWELEDGACLQCGFEASGDSESDSGDDSDLPSFRTVESEYDSDGIIIAPEGAMLREFQEDYYSSASDSEIDHADDYDDDDDMDGFINDEHDGIDDENDHGSQATLTDGRHPADHRHLHDPNDNHHTDDTGTQTTNYDEQSDVATNYDEPTEASDQDDDIRPSQRSSRRARRIVISDDEDNEGQDTSNSSAEEGEDEGSSDDSGLDETDDDEEGLGHSEATDQGETEGGDSDSDESDDTAIRTPQSFARRRVHLQSMRARRNEHVYRSHNHSDRFQQQSDTRHRNLHFNNHRLTAYGHSKRWNGASNNLIPRSLHGS